MSAPEGTSVALRTPRVVILGAGPAGLGAALGLARRGFAPTVVEAQDAVGGNAGSFTLHGLRVDYGSHRLHPATDPEILADLRRLLGDGLVERPRHGRILLGGRWVHFPLRALDLALHAPPSFVGGVAADALVKAARSLHAPPSASVPDTFASVLLRGLGPTVCRDFYFPYARKIWGLEPDEISPAQARRRVSAGTLRALVARLAPGPRGGGARAPKGVFHYPRDGFGRISEALAEAAVDAGARILLGTKARKVRTNPGVDATTGQAGAGGLAVDVEGPGGARTLECDHVWSTIPLSGLTRIADPAPPSEVMAAARGLEQRAMLLVYLVLEQDRFTGFDAHYFPSPGVPFTRLSEPKNYSGRRDPAGRTVLCAELPCSTADRVWGADDASLGTLVTDGLAVAGIPVTSAILDVAVRRLPAAYPLYRVGWEERFDAVDAWASGLPGLLTFGRQGLYAHDNTHHALAMARAAVACLGDDGGFDAVRWARYREDFTRHVVED
ncbi:MAG: FAD-dependent oxidoreductase [Longimicrobiales bacterium]